MSVELNVAVSGPGDKTEAFLLKENNSDSKEGKCDSKEGKCPTFCRLPAPLQRVLPPRGWTGQYITRAIACFMVWLALYVTVGVSALPGGNIFSVYVLLVAASFGGFLVHWPNTRFPTLPPLLGMLVVGFMLRNINTISIARHINVKWSSTLRSVALTVILLRSGLGLDIAALRKLKCTVLRLAFLPCVVEAVTVAVIANLLLNMPWFWAFQLGFILSAVSPAVVVPSMLQLQLQGFGVTEGIPTMVMAASSCDDVLAISMFAVFLGIAFSEGDVYFNIFRGPLEIVMGLAGGCLVGLLLWYFPWRRDSSRGANRVVLLLTCALVFLFGANLIKFPGAGALAVLTMATVAGYGWGENEKESVEKVLNVLWTIFQPLLFGLIGAEVAVQHLVPNLIGRGLAILFIGLVVRCITVFFVVMGNGLTVKERLFCILAWLPKATVQAAIGSIPLDVARRLKMHGSREEQLGVQIVTIAVLVILVTAPLGAVLISITGPRWLSKKPQEEPEPTDA